MDLSLLGLGTALPPYRMTQSEAAELAVLASGAEQQQASLVRVLYRRAGVKTRYTSLPHQVAWDWFKIPGDPPEMSVEDATAGRAAGHLNGHATVAANGRASATNGHAAIDEAVDLAGYAETNGSHAHEAGAALQEPAALGPSTRQRMIWYRQLAPDLAVRAATEALERAELSPEAITHLVTVSCTGFAAPGVDIELISRLGLPATTQRVQIGFMGCHGAINGLRAARGLAATDPQARVLLCAVELCTLHCRFDGDAGKIVSNAIFSDGAAAIVAGATPVANDWRLADTASCLIPDSTDAMSWYLGDNGFEMFLSAKVPDLICEHLRPWLVGWLAKHGLTIETVGSWAVHPGGPRILGAVEKSLDLPHDALSVSRDVLSECGNMSSPTVLFILDRLREIDAPRPCVALGFGPGLMAEAALWL
ncbi:MAG TPA: type III polyketide synthase [Pirellulales bacterium]|jgi:predicted naringenin-chalcone synthase|nr:type III polyketide synthase [Pirellulales bacterium]